MLRYKAPLTSQLRVGPQSHCLKTLLHQNKLRGKSQRLRRSVVWQRTSELFWVKAKKDEGGDSSVESLFQKELQRRGMSNESLSSSDIDFATKTTQEPFSSTSTKQSETAKTKATKTSPEGSERVEDQRKKSMLLVNEGLEGLLPRAESLFKLGSSIFLGFLPIILGISLLFGGIYLVMGDSFVHGGSTKVAAPSYVDPQDLLSEPPVDPYVPFQ